MGNVVFHYITAFFRSYGKGPVTLGRYALCHFQNQFADKSIVLYMTWKKEYGHSLIPQFVKSHIFPRGQTARGTRKGDMVVNERTIYRFLQKGAGIGVCFVDIYHDIGS